MGVGDERGNWTDVRRLVGEGADPNWQNEEGHTPLYIACQRGHESMVNSLISYGADIHKCSTRGETVLHVASRFGHIKVFRALLWRKGLSVDQRDNEGRTALYIACRYGHVAIVEKIAFARTLLGRRPDLDQRANDGTSALFTACEHGQDHLVNLLMWNGASPTGEDNEGRTPLYIASLHGHKAIVRDLLLYRWGNVRQATKRGETPLHAASSRGHDAVVQILLVAGASVDQCNDRGQTPLWIAAKEGHLSTLYLLVGKSNANVDHADELGRTPLFMAVESGHLDIVKFLISEGANVTQVAKDYATPLYVAETKGRPAIVAVILEAKSRQRQTPTTVITTKTTIGVQQNGNYAINNGSLGFGLSPSCQVMWAVLAAAALSCVGALAPGRIQFSPTTYAATNQWGSVVLLLQRALGADGPASVLLNSQNGSAVAGVDFAPIVNLSVAWAAGSWAPVQVPIAFLPRVLLRDVSFSINMSPGDGTTQIYPSMATATVTIQSINLDLGDLAFAAPAINISVPTTLAPTTPYPVSLSVERLGGSTGSLQVEYAIAPVPNLDPAQVPIPDTDFSLPTFPGGNVLFWADGDATPKTITLSFFNAAIYHSAKQLSLQLLRPSGGALLASPSTILLTVLGTNQAVPAGVFQLGAPCFSVCAATTYSVDEGGAVRVYVERRNGAVGAVSVQFEATPDPSTNTIATTDFVPQRGTLSWQDGDGASQSFVVQTQISPNTQKRVVVTLTNPTGGASLSPVASSTSISVLSLPFAPPLGGEVNVVTVPALQTALSGMPMASDQLLQAQIPVYQSGIGPTAPWVVIQAGTYTFTVRRSRGSVGAASVYVQTVGQTAQPDVDFVSVGQRISWQDTDARDVTVSLTILSPPSTHFSGTASPPRTLSIVLSDPQTVVLGPSAQYAVYLQATAQVPTLVGAQLEMTGRSLTLQYSRPVLATTANVASLSVAASTGLYTLSASSTVVPRPDPTLVFVQLAPSDVNALQRAGLAASISTTNIAYPTGFVEYPTFNCASTSINGCVVPPLPAQTPFPATAFVGDTLAPSLLRFVYDGQYLQLRFSKVVNPSSVVPSQLQLCDSLARTACALLSSASYVVAGTRSVGGLAALPPVPSDGTLITIFVAPMDKARIDATGVIGRSPATTILVATNQIADIMGHSLLPPYFLSASATADCSPCPTSSYLSARCSDSQSRVCLPCTVCAADHFAEMTCSPTHDTVCQRCTQCQRETFASTKCSPSTDRVCRACALCSADEFEAVPCSTEANRVCHTCNSCSLTPAQKTLCAQSVSWERRQQSPFGCPTPNQQWTSREEQLQSFKSNACGAGRCSCTGHGIGNNNPSGLAFPNDPRCTGPETYGILL
ncbi:hypothetical protein SDRG_16167 [Saprolegnia diclina VS20]|uniref:TNFR-Cys domain-containing protein n=1 Tax=Saprolegnia diclina (strain VS20) TaxID=1156394 RepID=T0PKW8_SAPDV|nr:hypothetical protein SDRG_16167 [Saprolegnia diclina VS20]EQC25979.1 hypothetical protein SDRG_16167 [Saprolegnia diclina VS20]|eukprot:XP_008620588.1 hypothetical protein SDRG_16167 [Saprolegnia diclina VS20]